jgi:hypothetical protein
MTLRLYFHSGRCFLTASEPFPTSGLLENSRGRFRKIALFPLLLFFRFTLRCLLVHVEVCHESCLLTFKIQTDPLLPTPTSFAEIVSNDSPVIHAQRIPARLLYWLLRTICEAVLFSSRCALTFWICAAYSFRFVARASISFCLSAAVIFCLGTVDLSCEKVASLIRPSGF